MDLNEEIDLTEHIVEGNVKEIIDVLEDILRKGYDRIFWDGYDSYIVAYKSTEGKKNEMV